MAQEDIADVGAGLVAWVRQAAPYIHAFRGRTFVIAFGGEVLEAGPEAAQSLAQDFNLLLVDRDQSPMPPA